MALTKNKTKTNHNLTKIQAKHHKKTKHYVKVYWPYIPILSIIVIGLIINAHIRSSTNSHPFTLSSLSIAEVLESSVGIVALCFFLLRHAFAWHKVFVKGEDFATKHPMIDIALVMIMMGGLILVHANIITA